MAFISQTSIQEVIDKMDAAAVVGDYVRLTAQSGGTYKGLCPFHNEKTPSFTVDADKKLYYCFGCHKGGTVLNFLMEMEKLTFPEAVETLARRFGISLVYENPDGGAFDNSAAKKNDELFELYRRTAGTFHHFLIKKEEGRAAKEYIVSRGISLEMIERFSLGYAPANRRWLHGFLTQKGYSAPFLASSGLFSAKYPQSSFFSGRLMFPIADRQGRIVAFGGRILPAPQALPTDTPPPKYINSGESEVYRKGQTLFAVDIAQAAIRKSGEAVLAEGYMDVIALHQAGVDNAVAPLGTSFTDEQAKLLRRWAERIILYLDTDSAGQNAVVKAIFTCRRNGLAASVVLPLEGEGDIPKDPAEILQKSGPEALKKSTKNCIIDLEYLINRSKVSFDLFSAGGKADAVASLFPYSQLLGSEVSREACLASVADAFGVDRSAVLRDYRRFVETALSRGPLVRGGENSRKEELPQKLRPFHQGDELSLLAAVAFNQALYPKFRNELSIKEIEDPAARELFIALEECFIHDEYGMDSLLSRISWEELRNYIVERGSSKEYSVNAELFISDGIRKQKGKWLERRLVEIDGHLRRLSPEENMEDLLSEKMEIHAELRRLKEDN